MTSTATPAGAITIKDRLRRVDALDLEPIAFKLTCPDAGAAALNLADADQGIFLYRCFLKLCLLHPDATIVPTQRIDHVWHTHMLDTSKYRADCQHVFGRFLDHFPYAGLRGERDRRAWRAAFARTRDLFRLHFGLEIEDTAASVCRIHEHGSDCCIDPASSLRPRPQRGPAAE
jgi:hypothetical protein